jgi:Phage integrase, N-terminal SAM-like domain
MPSLLWHYLTALLYDRTSGSCVALAEALETVSHDRLTRLLQGTWSGQTLLELTFKSVIERHLKPALGHLKLQQLKPTELKRYYNRAALSPTTLEQHHTLLHSALKAAQLQGLVQRNVASLVIGKPHRPEGREDVLHSKQPRSKNIIIRRIGTSKSTSTPS